MTQRTLEGYISAGRDAHPNLLPATGATPGQARPTLQDRIELMIGIPSTVNELACLLNARRKIVHATLHNLKRKGRAAVITQKYEDSANRWGPCQKPTSVWGTPGFKFIGYIKGRAYETRDIVNLNG